MSLNIFCKGWKTYFWKYFLDIVGDALSPPELGNKGWGRCRSPELGKKGMGLELGHRPCHLRAGHGTVFWHDPKHGTTQNILDRAGMTRTQGPCRA